MLEGSLFLEVQGQRLGQGKPLGQPLAIDQLVVLAWMRQLALESSRSQRRLMISKVEM